MSWEIRKFSKIVDINPKVKLEKKNIYPFIPMEDIDPYFKIAMPLRQKEYASGGARFENDDIIFARITPCLEHGKIAKVKNIEANKAFGSTEFFVFRAIKDVSDPDFIYYLSKSSMIMGPAIKSMVGSSGRQRAQKSVIEEIELPIPQLSEQQKIAEILSNYDDLIENNRKRIKLLEESARLLYEEWFVNFRFPGYEKAKFKDGIPEGWERKTIPEVIDFNPKEKANKNSQIKYIPMAALSVSGMNIDNAQAEERNKSTNVLFRNNDILLARITPCLENGKTAYVNILDDDEIACGSTEFIVMRGVEVSPFFVYCLARSYNFREKAIKSMIGSSGRQRVQIKVFDEYEILKPNYDTLEYFDEFSEPIFTKIKNLCKQNQKLSEARDLLLPRLISGEIEV